MKKILDKSQRFVLTHLLTFLSLSVMNNAMCQNLKLEACLKTSIESSSARILTYCGNQYCYYTENTDFSKNDSIVFTRVDIESKQESLIYIKTNGELVGFVDDVCFSEDLSSCMLITAVGLYRYYLKEPCLYEFDGMLKNLNAILSVNRLNNAYVLSNLYNFHPLDYSGPTLVIKWYDSLQIPSDTFVWHFEDKAFTHFVGKFIETDGSILAMANSTNYEILIQSKSLKIDTIKRSIKGWDLESYSKTMNGFDLQQIPTKDFIYNLKMLDKSIFRIEKVYVNQNEIWVFYKKPAKKQRHRYLDIWKFDGNEYKLSTNGKKFPYTYSHSFVLNKPIPAFSSDFYVNKEYIIMLTWFDQTTNHWWNVKKRRQINNVYKANPYFYSFQVFKNDQKS